MRGALSGAIFRQTFRLQAYKPRFASTSTENAQKKAQDAMSTAQKSAQMVWASTLKVLGPLGERLGNLLGSYRQPIMYNLSVARELLKQVYIAERLQPPRSLSAVTNVYSTLWSRASSPTYWREILKNGQWAQVSVYAVEAYGIFKIGEIVGRGSLVGYNVR